MKSNLLKSFLVVAIFWHLVTTVMWSMGDPKENLASLQRLDSVFPFLHLNPPQRIDVTGALDVQLLVLKYWTLPVLLLTLLCVGAGSLFLWKVALRRRDERAVREKRSEVYRTVESTVGEMPQRKPLPCDESLELCADGDDMLKNLTERELLVLSRLLGTIAAHPDAFATPAENTTLLDHALTIVGKALEFPKYPGLIAIVATALEMGKITAYTKDSEGNWKQTKDVEKEAAKYLVAMPAWTQLPTQDKNAVILAVSYYNSHSAMPNVKSDVVLTKMAKELLFGAAKASNRTIEEAKSQVIERTLQELASSAAAAEAVALPPPAQPAVQIPVSMPKAFEPAPAVDRAERTERTERAKPAEATASRRTSPSTPVAQPAPQVVAPVAAAPQSAPAEEFSYIPQEPVAENKPLKISDYIFDEFLKSLPDLAFQNRGLPKAVSAVAWKKGNRVYLIEIKLRDTIMNKLAPAMRDALTPTRERPRVQPFTKELLQGLHERKWLVTSIDGTTIDAAEALWNVNAGKLAFKGIIVVDIPEEYMQQLPADDSMYEIQVTGPWLTSAIRQQGAMSRQDLLGLSGVLNNGPKS